MIAHGVIHVGDAVLEYGTVPVVFSFFDVYFCEGVLACEELVCKDAELENVRGGIFFVFEEVFWSEISWCGWCGMDERVRRECSDVCAVAEVEECDCGAVVHEVFVFDVAVDNASLLHVAERARDLGEYC